MLFLTSTDYPTIRGALHVSLTSAELSDALLGSDLYVPAAEAEVLALDPLALTRTGDELARVKRAVLFLTAALLAAVVPVPQSFTESDVTESLTPWDPEKRAALLRSMAMRELSGLGIATPPRVGYTYVVPDPCPLW
jgi:hypothetical protein